MNFAPSVNIPARLGRYDVRGKIGEGGMAAVFLGYLRDEAGGGQFVALKVIKDVFALNQEFVSMFSDEAKIVSRFSHPNIVRVFELGAEGNRLFMAMEFINGQPLWAVWNACRGRGVRLRYDLTAWIGSRIASGLHHAHELRDARGDSLNIVHRDVNASNVIIGYDGQVKVIDFGLAKAANRISKTRAGMVKGKLAYMAPEQVLGRPIDRRTDVYALGITLWELTVDQRLFKGADDVETMEKVNAGLIPNPLRLVEGYPPDLWRVIERALQRDPRARYRDCGEMAADLERVSRVEGRFVNEGVVSGIMQALFTEEKSAQDRWLIDAAGQGPARDRPSVNPPPAPDVLAAVVPVPPNDPSSKSLLEEFRTSSSSGMPAVRPGESSRPAVASEPPLAAESGTTSAIQRKPVPAAKDVPQPAKSSGALTTDSAKSNVLVPAVVGLIVAIVVIVVLAMRR